MAKEKPGVMMYWSTFDVLEALLDGQAKTMLRAIRNYSQYGEAPDFGCDTVLATLWLLIRPLMDADNERYERITEKRRKAGLISAAKRATDANTCQQVLTHATDANTCQQIQPNTVPDPEPISDPNPEANSKAKSNPVYEGRRDCANAHSAPRTNLPSVALTPEQEAENERLRKEAMDKLRGWQG